MTVYYNEHTKAAIYKLIMKK